MRAYISLLLLLAALSCGVSGFFASSFERTREPIQIIPRTRRGIPTLWIEQRLDHFNPRDTRTWQMRYMANDECFKPGGPIVIYIGGEWEINSASLQGGMTYGLAKQEGGYMFYTEHRFYGKSHPTPDTSAQNLKYLSVDQALADLAYFVRYIKQTNEELSKSKVVVIGGSYAGTMAAWFRMKYPHLVDAAWASSAPLLAVPDFYQYHEIVGKSLVMKGEQECYDIVEKAISQLKEELQKPEGPESIKDKFNLCKPVNMTSDRDREYFFASVASVFSQIVQYHSFSDIELACTSLLRRPGGQSELDALAELAKRKWQADPCKIADYDGIIELYGETSWTEPANEGNMRQWIYQTCTEFGFYQTASSTKQPFGKGAFTLENRIRICEDIFREAIGENGREILERAVKRTNMLYGALTPAVTQVIFTHGTVDPWHAIGVQEDVNELSPTIIVPGTSHCMDLQTPSFLDSDEMKTARERILGLLAKWLSNTPERHH